MTNTNRKIHRGAILRCTSGAHKGDYYLFIRTMSGKDKTTDFLGNTRATAFGARVRFTFNLINLTGDDGAGKSRQSEHDRQFITTMNGIDQGIDLYLIEQHYGMTFEDVTDMASIKVDVKEILDEKREENIAANAMLDMGKVLMSMLPGLGGANMVPLLAPDKRTVLAYVVQA